jgi:hypothetical protein
MPGDLNHGLFPSWRRSQLEENQNENEFESGGGSGSDQVGCVNRPCQSGAWEPRSLTILHMPEMSGIS